MPEEEKETEDNPIYDPRIQSIIDEAMESIDPDILEQLRRQAMALTLQTPTFKNLMANIGEKSKERLNKMIADDPEFVKKIREHIDLDKESDS